MRPRVARRASEVRHRTLRFRPSLKTSLKTNRESVIERARGSQLALSDDERRDDKLAQLVTRSEGGGEGGGDGASVFPRDWGIGA